MSLGDVELDRRPAAVFIRNSTSFFIDHMHTDCIHCCIEYDNKINFVNDMGEAHFINPSELFTQSPKTSPMGPF